MGGRTLWFHVMQLLNGRYQGECVYFTVQRNAPPARPLLKGQLSRRTTQGVSRPAVIWHVDGIDD